MDYKNVLLHAISKPDESVHTFTSNSVATRSLTFLAKKFHFLITQTRTGRKKMMKSLSKSICFVKDNSTADDIFVALSECASLHPCESDSESEFDGIVESESEGETETENSENEAKGVKLIWRDLRMQLKLKVKVINRWILINNHNGSIGLYPHTSPYPSS